MLCAMDPARRRRVRDDAAFHYVARSADGESLSVETRDDGSICVDLPPPSAVEGALRYGVVSIHNGVASSALAVHLWDLGPARGYQVAGVER
jgi:hypothetical protein